MGLQENNEKNRSITTYVSISICNSDNDVDVFVYIHLAVVPLKLE